jgi:L-2,4-diaminobutyrate decarboxylase
MPADFLSTFEADCDPEIARAFYTIAAEYMTQTRSRDGRVSSQHTPAGLAARFDEPPPRTGHSVDAIIRRLRSEVIPDCNHLYHPRYVGHQVPPPLPIAVWMESVTAALNQSASVFEMSPVGTVLEHRVVSWLCELAGFTAAAGGTLTTGGTEATFTALLAARNAAMPESWTKGVGNDPPALLCGEHTHYAVTRAAGELGIGMRSVLPVRSREFKLDPIALRQALQALAREGRRVMAVVATAGSTPTGSFDDLEAIANLCDEHGVWLRARSLVFDPHKMMLLPLQAGVLLMRHEQELDAAFTQRAPYLFQAADSDRVWDQGTRSFLCSRRVDAFKVWVAIQRYGLDQLGQLYDHLCALTRFAWEVIDDRPDFESIHEPECNILCFRYVGDPSLRDAQIDELNRQLRERYNRSGEGWITGTSLDGRRVLRITVMNPRTTNADIKAILDGLAKIGQALIKGLS